MVGGMAVIELLTCAMRRGRGGIAAVGDDMRQTYTVKHIRKGLVDKWILGGINANIRIDS